MKIISFDVGGTKIAKAVVEIRKDGRFEILDHKDMKNPSRPEPIREIFLDFSNQAKKKYGANKVSISSARLVDNQKIAVSGAKKYYGKENFDFNFLRDKGFEIKIDNDGSCFALGEYFQLEEKPKVLLGIAFGTGIGGGLVVGGKSFKGAHFSSMEIGHMIIEKGGEKCFCGQKGCWETYAGGRGIEKYYRSVSSKNKIKVFQLAKKGDKTAQRALERAEDYAVSGIINLLNIFDPQSVVFGGGISKHKFFMDRIIGKLKKTDFNNKKQAAYHYKISKLRHGSNLLGAASLWLT